jgi:hypothetical protein
MKVTYITLLAISLAACRDESEASHASRGLAEHCPVASHDARLDSTLFAGLSITRNLAEVRGLCPQARVDTVGVGGTQPIALTVAAPGVVISAVQTKYEAYGDTLHTSEQADLWVAQGDSLRFPDGALIPRSVGAWRSIDSLGVIVVDHGDDGTGSFLIRCKYPRLRAIVNNVWPPFAQSGVLSLRQVSTEDSTSIWRIELDASVLRRDIVAACARAAAT